MKFFLAFILTALFAFAVGLYLPWWSLAITSFIVALVIPQSAGKAFLAAFFAVFILWSYMAFVLSNANGHLLAHRVSMLILKTDSPFMIILVSGLIGGIVAAFAALSGNLLRRRTVVVKETQVR